MRAATLVIIVLVGLADGLGAQQWMPADSLQLITRAIARRTARDLDSLLAGWRARAHGIVRFASVIQHGGRPVERVIKVDELQVEVYGEAPNRSKQVITAWRDTTLLPNNIVYHRDHLGIVAHDFGGTIRLGEGDEVRDVDHPLSPTGARGYLFALGDTLTIAGSGRPTRVVTVQVRPVDASAPAAVGLLFLDIDRAELVRFRFTFTPAAYRDATIEAITVLLENALQEGVRWLPWRQAIVITRGTAWLDLPIRTVIRGDWTIDDYQLGVRHAATTFRGAFIDGLRTPRREQAWTTPLDRELQSMAPIDEDVDAARREAVRLLGNRLGGLPRSGLWAGGMSDVIRVTRVQGVAPSVAGRIALSTDIGVAARIGGGLSDHRLFGEATATLHRGPVRWSLRLERAVRDVSDERIMSGIANSLATLLGGNDRLDWTRIDRAMLGFDGSLAGLVVRADAGRERSQSVAAVFDPIRGSSRTNPALGVGTATVGRMSVTTLGPSGQGLMVGVEAGEGETTWARVAGEFRAAVTVGRGELLLRGRVGAGTAGLPPYRHFVIGGRGTLPGVAHRSVGGRRLALMEVAWMQPVSLPTPAIPFSRQIELPSRIGVLGAVGIAGGDSPTMPWRARGRVEPVVGLRLDLWGPLARLEAAVGLRTGDVAVTVDAHPDWWPLL